MTPVLITTDTELSASRHRAGWSARANFDSSIRGRTMRGDHGIGWQMDRLDAHGLTGAFFVDPLPALVLGRQVIADIVGPIVARGHEVQLHLHTEWLEWISDSPVGGRQGRNIADFGADDQRVLLMLARDLLIAAGAPPPDAFRAGNYGADDVTLTALAAIGIMYDTSYNAAYAGAGCAIGLPPRTITPRRYRGVTELPVSGLCDRPGGFRPAQLCAMSRWEMRAALRHSARANWPAFTIVSHSFELLSRDRKRANGSTLARFEAMCRTIARHPSLTTLRYRDLDPHRLTGASITPLAPNPVRTVLRQTAQAMATWRYERRWRPA